MVLVAKVALGFAASVAAIGACAIGYTFRQGLLRVDVDEMRNHGSHVHVWLPAAAVPMALHLIPRQRMAHMDDHAAEFMPLLHAVAKELKRYPDAEFVEGQDGPEHFRVRTHNGSLLIDVDSPGEHVHVACPLETIDDVAMQLASFAPAS